MKNDSMNSWVVPALLFLAVLAFAGFALAARARSAKSTLPRFDPLPDMDHQRKFRAQNRNPMFADGRAMRRPVPGTVARGALKDDDHFYRGIAGGAWAADFPVRVDDALLLRGRQRYEIYCAVCHGLAGYGDGMVAKRADALQEGTWTPPPSYHEDRIRNMPAGQIFHTITHGVRNMPAYGPQIPEADRWAIAAYVRALQRSRNARMEDVPEEVKPALK